VSRKCLGLAALSVRRTRWDSRTPQAKNTKTLMLLDETKAQSVSRKNQTEQETGRTWKSRSRQNLDGEKALGAKAAEGRTRAGALERTSSWVCETEQMPKSQSDGALGRQAEVHVTRVERDSPPQQSSATKPKRHRATETHEGRWIWREHWTQHRGQRKCKSVN
jgi:hypothetical protein